MDNDGIVVIEHPDLGAGKRYYLECKFTRYAYGDKSNLEKKRIELIRDVIAWIYGLEGDDAHERDSFIRGLQSYSASDINSSRGGKAETK